MTKIRSKLLLAFIIVSLIPLIVVGGYALTTISNSLRAASNNKLEDKISLVSFGIEDFLKNVSTDLFYLRDSSSLQTMITEKNESNFVQTEKARKNLELDFLAFSKHKAIYHQIRFLDTTGMEILRVDRNMGTSMIVPRGKLQNKKKRYYFADTAKLGNGELMISPLDLNREKGQVEQPLRPVIRYGTPVYDDNNQLQGIVLLNVLADKFLDLVRQENKGSEKVLFVSDKGFYYSNPDSKKVWGGKTDLDTGNNFAQDFPSIANQVLGSSYFKKFDHDQYIVAAAPVFLDTEKNRMLGLIVSIIPTAEVFSSVTKFRNIFFGISAAVFLTTLILGIGLAKSITDPIVYLTKMTQAMSKGQLSTSVEVTSKDETKLLAESVERLRRSMTLLLKRMKKKK